MCWLQQSAQLWSYPTFLLIPLMVLGCVECFAGYRAWRFLLGVNGAALGFVAGATLCALLGAPMLILVGAVGGGIAGALLFAGIQPVGTFIFAFGSTASLTILLAHIALPSPPLWIKPLAAAIGLAGALAALAGCRPFIIAIVALAGAQQVASAWRAHEVPRGALPLPDAVTASESAIFILLAAAGLFLQFADRWSVSPNEAQAAASQESQATITPPSR